MAAGAGTFVAITWAELVDVSMADTGADTEADDGAETGADIDADIDADMEATFTDCTCWNEEHVLQYASFMCITK